MVTSGEVLVGWCVFIGAEFFFIYGCYYCFLGYYFGNRYGSLLDWRSASIVSHCCDTGPMWLHTLTRRYVQAARLKASPQNWHCFAFGRAQNWHCFAFRNGGNIQCLLCGDRLAACMCCMWGSLRWAKGIIKGAGAKL